MDARSSTKSLGEGGAELPPTTQYLAVVKGAPDRLLPMVQRTLTEQGGKLAVAGSARAHSYYTQTHSTQYSNK